MHRFHPRPHSPFRLVSAAALLAVLFTLVARPIRAQEEEASEPLILENADSTEMFHVGAALEYHLFGDVRFSHGRSRLSGERAVWRPEVGQVEFYGNVVVRQPQSWLAAQQMIYRRDTRTIVATGDVRVEDTAEGFSLRSQRTRFDRSRLIAVADSLPVVYWDFLLDSAAQTIVSADTITFYRSEKRGIGIGSVRVRKGDWLAQGDRGEIWPDSGRAVLTGNPNALGGGGAINGDTLVVEFAGRSLKHVQATGHASGSFRDTATAGWVTLIRGRRADFYLANDTLRAIRVVGEAYTDHQPSDSTKESNHASGDSLWLRFAGGRLASATIEGGAQGKFLSGPSGGSDTVQYSAARIRFVPDSNRFDLETDGQLRYRNILLDAGRVSYWTDTKNLLARPLPSADSTGRARQEPRLADGQQVITGSQLAYNIDTRRGRIRSSSTTYEGAYYKGGDFRKYTDTVFFVTSGIYTTCDRDEPHFRFESRDMEIIRDDKVIARPVVLKIGELPVAILPYYVFPIRRGRHSGFLPLRFGNFTRGERFIGNAGYYWAASDYWDLEGALDYNEQTGVLLHSRVNYAWRYHFSGGVSGTYARQSVITPYGQSKSTRWSLRGSHQQTLSPSASLAGTADFVSDKSYYQDYSFDPTDRRQRLLRSQLNFNKRWQGASVNVAVENVQNLDTDSRTRTLPQVNLTVFQRRILSPDSGKTARWYHNGYVSWNSRLLNYDNRDSIQGPVPGRFDSKQYLTVDHSASVSFPQRLFGSVNVSPNASVEETWYYVFGTRLAQESGILVNKPARRMAMSAGLGINANLYGFVRPRLWGLSSIRHTITPQIGYTFTPPVSRHDQLRAYTGTGGGSARRSQAIGLSLSNVLDAKLFEGDKSKERRVSLLNFGLSTSYNFEAKQRRWSNLSGSIRTSLARRLDLSADATWDPYDATTLNLRWSHPRLQNFGLSAGMSLRGAMSALTSVTALGEERHPESGEGDTTGAATRIPFNASFSYRYSESRAFQRTYKTNWIAWRFDLSPSVNWSLQYSQTYDLVRQVVTDQTFELRRNLHCWEAVFVWRPGGSGQGYYFRINVKAIPDIKIERSESGLLGAFRGAYTGAIPQ